MQSPRLMLAYSALSISILYLLYNWASRSSGTWLSSHRPPDFSRYVSLDSLSVEQFPLDDVDKRVIIVGDIHGMFDEFQSLLAKVSYNPVSDTLISVGDIVAKGPHAGSMSVLNFMAAHNITAVRGNHDQKVIEWRTWLEWIHTLPGGSDWLVHVQERWDKAQEHGADDVEEWVEEQVRHDKKHSKWWKRIPEGWQLFGDHYRIAEEMTHEQYLYMVQRPVRLHVPHAHTFIVHAGVLASDPNYKPGNKRQPLSHIPTLYEPYADQERTSILRRLQELAILKEVPQNLIPWVTLNMRGVLDDNTVTSRKKDGTPWAELYKKDMKRCAGFESKDLKKKKKGSLPCHPATVVYGHAASRGLDINRWTFGLDSGCVYNRRMTALVLGAKVARDSSDTIEDEFDGEAVDIDGNIISSRPKFGDKGHGRIYSVSC
ncbi:Metallo-dependent phosphatase-like protein [Lentinula raphanica]|nr:Metallo-dependent phosphatase-like protein [Lentinula raphanica]